MATGHRVTALLVQAKKADGSYVHVYEAGFLPEDMDEEHLAQLVEGGMVEEADLPDEEEGTEPAPRRRKAKAE